MNGKNDLQRPWQSTGNAADKWEALRKGMSPCLLPSAFIARCDYLQATALRFDPTMELADQHEYVVVCLKYRANDNRSQSQPAV